MSPTPQVSVVLACHSDLRWASIMDAVNSISAQSRQAEQMIIAVDHNPALATRLRAELVDVDVVMNDSNERGAGATRNIGAKQATAELIAFLDDDEVAEPNWLNELIAPFADPAVIGTGGRYKPAWQSGKPSWFPDIFAWVVGAHHEGMPQVPSKVRNVWAGNMAVRRDIFASTKGFKTDFGKVGQKSQPEDTEFCIRSARISGGHWIYTPAAVIHHEVPTGRSNFPFFLLRCYSEGHGKILLKGVLGMPGDALTEESAYLKKDVPRSLGREVRNLPGSWRRILAIAAGILASALGAMAGTIALRRSR